VRKLGSTSIGLETTVEDEAISASLLSAGSMITSDCLDIDRKREEGGENEVASVEKSIVVWRTERGGVERRNQLGTITD
jgi:hypothetical protein